MERVDNVFHGQSNLVYVSMIIRSLRKSMVRKKVLLYLYKIYPQPSYLSEISKHIKIDASNVLGALKGMGKRYKKSKSLMELGLVEELKIDGFSYYKLSEKGMRILREVSGI